MKAKLEQLLGLTNDQSFLCYEVVASNFEFWWHYHPEYELTYIVKGKGKRLVGDSYLEFNPGDLVLIGPMLPHTWISDLESHDMCHAIVIQFTEKFVKHICEFPEMGVLRKLFEKANRGLEFIHSKNERSPLLIEQMIHSNGMHSFSLMIQLLHQLVNKKSQPIASVPYKLMKGNENQQRINSVFLYVQRAFKETISLKKAASIIHLSESAFCKFFKRTSGKTFSDYTNEIRIAYACQLLIETDKPIIEIANDSGFESLTYFNRVFLRKKGMRPGEYRRM